MYSFPDGSATPGRGPALSLAAVLLHRSPHTTGSDRLDGRLAGPALEHLWPVLSGHDRPPKDDREWAVIVKRALSAHLGAALYVALKSVDTPSLPHDSLDILRAEYLQNVQRNMRLEHALLHVLDHLQDEGVEPVAVKGVALLGFLYGDIGGRTLSDIDLIVPATSANKTIATLKRLGYVPPPDASAVTALSGITCRNEGNGIEVDVHWSIAKTAFHRSRFGFDSFEGYLEPVESGGRVMRTLCPELHFLYLAEHLFSHSDYPEDARLRWTFDLLLLLLRERPVLDWARLVELAEAFALVTPLQAALRDCGRIWSVAPPDPWAGRIAGLQASADERDAFRVYLETDRSIGMWAEAIRHARSLPEALSLIRQALLPSPSFMRTRYGVRSAAGLGWAYVRRWASAVRKLTSGGK